MSVFDEKDYPEWFDIAKSYGYSDFDATKAAFKYTALDSDSSNIVKTFSMISSGAKEAAENVSASSGTIVRGLAAIKGGATGLWSSLSAFGKIGLVIAGIVAIKKVWDFLDDTFVITGKTAERKMSEASEAYDSAKSDVEAVNTQLAETKDRIAEINAKGPLTITEKEELNNLTEQNKLLEMELDLKQKIADVKAAEAANSAAKNFSKNYGTGASEDSVKDLVKQYEERHGKNSFSNLGYDQMLEASTYFQGDGLNEQIFELQAFQKIRDNMLADENTQLEDLNYVNEQISGIKAGLNDEALSLVDIINNIGDTPGLETALEQAKTSLDLIYKETDHAKWKQMHLDDFFSEQDISNEKEDLLSLAKKRKYDGGIKASDLSSKFQEAADKAGLADVLGTDYIQTIVDQINSEAGVVDVNKLRLQIFNKVGRGITGNNKTSKEFSDWISSISPEDTELVYKLSLDADSANWTLEQWQQRLADLKSGADTAIADFQTKVTDAIDVQNKLVSAFAAGNSATGMTNEQIKEVCNSFKELDGFEIDKLFERTATGVQMNAEAFENFNKQIQNQNLIELYTALEAKQKKYNEAVESGSEANAKSYMSDIQQLQLLINELEAATSKYNAFVTASSSANRRDSFSNVAAGYKSVKTLLDQGWVSDDSVTSYLDLLLGDGWEAKTEGDAKKAFRLISDSAQSEAGKVTGHSLQSYMTTDGSGNLTSQGAWTFAEDLVNLQNKGMFKDLEGSVAYKDEGDILHLDLTGKNLDTVAEKLGTTTDMVELLGKALSDAGMDVKFSSAADKISTARDELTRLEEEQKTLQQGTQEWADNQSKIATQNKIIANVTVEEAISGGTTLEELDAMDGKTIQETFDLNADQAQAVMDNIDARIQEAKDAEITVKIDEGQLSQLMGLDSLDVNVNPKVEEAPEIPDGEMNVKANVTNNPPEIKNGTMDVTANPVQASTGGTAPETGGTANYSADFSGIDNAPDVPGTADYTADFSGIGSAPTITGTVVYSSVFSGGGASRASGTMLSVAKADGTAYNVLNYKRLSPSHAGGNVALLNDENALTNEVG